MHIINAGHGSINQKMVGWFISRVGWIIGWQLDSSVRVSVGFAPLPATNGDDDNTYSCARRQGATDQREDATILIDASAL